MKYYFKSSAIKDLRRLPKDIQKKIIEKLDFYTNADNPLKFAEALKDVSMGEYRFRVGNYRVIFDLFKNSLIILAVGHRKEIYR